MTTPGRRRGPRGDVSAQKLLAAADRVLTQDGLAGLSLRAVARAADITPNTLYTYFTDMAELRNHIGDSFLGRLDLTLLQQEPPQVGLRTFLDHALDLFDGSPGHAELLATQRILGPHALDLNEALLNFLIDRVKHPPAVAAGLTTFLTEWVHGKVLLSPSNPMTTGFQRLMSKTKLADHPRTMTMLSEPGDDDAVVDLIVAAITQRR